MINKISALQSAYSQSKNNTNKSNVAFGIGYYTNKSFLNPERLIKTTMDEITESEVLIDLTGKLFNKKVGFGYSTGGEIAANIPTCNIDAIIIQEEKGDSHKKLLIERNSKEYIEIEDDGKMSPIIANMFETIKNKIINIANEAKRGKN